MILVDLVKEQALPAGFCMSSPDVQMNSYNSFSCPHNRNSLLAISQDSEKKKQDVSKGILAKVL